VQEDQVVGLAASEGRLEPNERAVRRAFAGKAAHHLLHNRLESLRRKGVFKESTRVLIDWIGLTIDDILEPGREHLVPELDLKDFGTRLAVLENQLHESSNPVGRSRLPTIWSGALVVIALGFR